MHTVLRDHFVQHFDTPVEYRFQFEGTLVFFLFPFPSVEDVTVLLSPT
jgi:hypothetical protein